MSSANPTITTFKLPTQLLHGKVIGSYFDKPIYESLTDEHGVKRVFYGIAPNANQLEPGAIFVPPGMIYTIQA